MALFGLNWEESKWPGHFSSTFLNFFASKIGVKLPPKKKVPWQWRCPMLSRVSNCHFCPKNAFFRQKKAFFQKVHFIQKCSGSQNKVFQCVKKNFFQSNPKLIFFTKSYPIHDASFKWLSFSLGLGLGREFSFQGKGYEWWAFIAHFCSKF